MDSLQQICYEMANSERYNKLLSRISQLECNLLPAPKINGNYTKKESDMIRSYVLLSHAEIESYFEDIADSKVRKALSEWMSKRTKSNCLLAIMSYCTEEINWNNLKKTDKDKLDYRISLVTRHYLNKLIGNHGIKSTNLLSILLPIGIESSEIDPSWLNTMDNFGSKRGQFAHTSSSVQSQIDLVTEKNNLNNSILPEIRNIDILVKKIK
ncbi:HEPN domain-containing protein [Aquirufa sp. 5-AUSEE-100C1]